MIDPLFRVEVIKDGTSPNPQRACWGALRQDYCEDAVMDFYDRWPLEQNAGNLVIEHCLKNGHFGVIEHPQIVFNCIGFSHDVMQQLRTHRHLSMDVQSGRYTGQRFVDVANGDRRVEEVFYIRPVGYYTDRQGKKYAITQNDRIEDIEWCLKACHRYAERLKQGWAEEHARQMIPFSFRQNWIVSCNMRSLTHILTIRGKKDAQLEIQQMCELMLPHFEEWAPEIYQWFADRQWQKGRLAP